MKGAPAARLTLACVFTSAARWGSAWIPVRNEAVRAAIGRARQRRAERGAELGGGVLKPPDLGALLGGTEETVTAPSCDASAPIPKPTMSRGRHDGSVGADFKAPDQHHDAGDERQDAEAHDAARIGVGEEARDAGGRDEQRKRERQQAHAGLDRRHAERHREEQRHDEEDAGLDEEEEEEADEPAGELPVFEERRRR